MVVKLVSAAESVMYKSRHKQLSAKLNNFHPEGFRTRLHLLLKCNLQLFLDNCWA